MFQLNYCQLVRTLLLNISHAPHPPPNNFYITQVTCDNGTYQFSTKSNTFRIFFASLEEIIANLLTQNKFLF